MASILIVDDEPTSQRMLSYTLRKAGYSVRTAANGAVGISMLTQSRDDLAILDVAMPVMDGLTMLRTIRADAQLQNIPVIMLTASGDDLDQQVAEEQGISGFLTKPSSSQTILQMVASIIGN